MKSRFDEMGQGPPRAPADPSRSAIKSRHRSKLVVFIVAESIAIAVLIVSILMGLSLHSASEFWAPVLRVLPVGAAAVAAILPIVFFGTNRPRRR
jgi:fatty acid desaturase